MLSFIGEKGNCTGCSACESSCPVHCISMSFDEEGFWYPESTEACINCGLCEKVCPVKNSNRTEIKETPECYAYVTNDHNNWKQSASGGAFSDLCCAWGDENTVFVGATWDGLTVHHVCVEGYDKLPLLKKSKYVASYPENSFAQIKEYLQEDRKVVYCGTPCQVSGLKLFLRKDYKNLLTIDLICHGVGSPLVFNECVKVLEKRLHGTISQFTFRAKRDTYEMDYLSSVLVNGKLRYLRDDIYSGLFLKQLCLRPSCGKNCHFRNEHRQGDITLADLKGLTNILPKYKDLRKNFSAISANSEKGKQIVSELSQTGILERIDVSDIKQYNPLYYRQTWFSEERDEFFNLFINNPAGAINKWKKKKNIKTIAIQLMPSQIVDWLSKNISVRKK